MKRRRAYGKERLFRSSPAKGCPVPRIVIEAPSEFKGLAAAFQELVDREAMLRGLTS